MRIPRYVISSIFLFILIFVISVGTVKSLDQDDVSIQGTIDSIFLDGSNLSVEFTADVSYLTLPANEIKYSHEDIEQAGPELRGAIKYALKSDIVSQLKDSFPNCLITSVYELPQYESGFFHDKYQVNLTPQFFSLNKNVSSFELVNGLLDAGVFVNYSFPWYALPGWNNTYTVFFSEGLVYKRTNGNVEDNTIRWKVFNGEGDMDQRIGSITIKDLNPTTNPSQNETVSFLLSLDCRTPNQMNMSLQLQAHRLSMNNYQCVPSVLSLPVSLPADAIRLCVQNNLTNYEMVTDLSFKAYKEIAIDALKHSSFNQSFNISFIWDKTTTVNCSQAYVIDSMDEKPPVTRILTDPSVRLTFFNISGKAFFGLINAGGHAIVDDTNVNFANVFDTVSLQSSAELYLPQHVQFNQSNSISWNHSNEFLGNVTSEKSPTYSNQKVTRNYIIDVKNTDLNLLSFFTGKTEVNLGIGFEKIRKMYVMDRSSDLSIPTEVSLPFVNADAFRLCVLENVFSTEGINEYIKSYETEFENMSRRLFPSIKGSAVNDKHTFEESLRWDGNISSMDSTSPIIIRQRMESTAPLSCHFSLFPPNFSFERLNLTFVGTPKETVTYNMTFPKGISINVISSSQQLEQTVLPDGTTKLSTTLNASEDGKVATILLSMQPSIVYVISLFVPCIISVFITLILFFVVYVIRKKRNLYRQNRRGPVSDPGEDYENEDYYVPPKPPSSK